MCVSPPASAVSVISGALQVPATCLRRLSWGPRAWMKEGCFHGAVKGVRAPKRSSRRRGAEAWIKRRDCDRCEQLRKVCRRCLGVRHAAGPERRSWLTPSNSPVAHLGLTNFRSFAVV